MLVGTSLDGGLKCSKIVYMLLVLYISESDFPGYNKSNNMGANASNPLYTWGYEINRPLTMCKCGHYWDNTNTNNHSIMPICIYNIGYPDIYIGKK